MTSYHIAPDADGCPTIWTDYDHAVAHRDGDRIHVDPAFAGEVWSTLERVFAPAESTVERLARGARPALFDGHPERKVGPGTRYERDSTRELVRGFLAALISTSGGGEHG